MELASSRCKGVWTWVWDYDLEKIHKWHFPLHDLVSKLKNALFSTNTTIAFFMLLRLMIGERNHSIFSRIL